MITEAKKRDIALVVDDTPETLRLLTDALDGAGMTEMVALDGAGAIQRDHYGHPCAVERVGEEPQGLRGIIDDERDIALFGFSDHSCAAS
jgi:CheY-like chemotaxis protein